jgi:D-alanyl-D-alanine carboxypeptidase
VSATRRAADKQEFGFDSSKATAASVCYDRRMRHILLFALTLACAASNAFADASAPADPPADAPAFQTVLDTLRTSRGITGASVTVIFSDGTVWNGAGGIAGAQDAATPETVYEIASVTKAYTSALVLGFVADGSLSLDDSLTKWMPDFPNAAGVTVRQLLQHTSGLYNYSEDPAYIPALRSDFSRVWTPEESLAYMQDPYFPPGTGWHYSNANYLLLGLILEDVSNQRFAALMRARVLDPNQLAHTAFRPDETAPGPMAHAYIDINDDGKPEDISMFVTMTPFITAAWSAGALVATSQDAARFMRAFAGGAMLTDSLNAEVTSWVDRGDGMEYGLGLIRKPHGEDFIYGHMGNSAGYSATVWHAPQATVTVAVLTNAHAIDVTSIALALLDLAQENPTKQN